MRRGTGMVGVDRAPYEAAAPKTAGREMVDAARITRSAERPSGL
jgi:hypothetical protein